MSGRASTPPRNTANYTPSAQHPQSTGQDYYVSWNNKQAKGYSTAGFGDGSVHRANLLDDRVKALVAQGGVTRSSLTRAMAQAAVTDLRGEDVLPELLQVLRTAPVTDPQLATAIQQLEAWQADGSQRRATSQGSGTYTHPDAVRLMDAWWPLLVEAEFRPGLGDPLYSALTANLGIDESPSAGHGPTGAHAGSAFQYGWWSYADKDLRTVLGEPGPGSAGPRVLRRRQAGRLPREPARHPEAGRRQDPGPGLPRGRRLRGRRPVVRRLHRAAPARRHHPVRDQLAEPADLPAGRRVPQPPLGRPWPRVRSG